VALPDNVVSFLLHVSVTLVSSICYQLLPLIRTHFIQGVSKTFGQTSGITSPHQNLEKISMNVCPQRVCEVQPTTCLS